MPNAKDVAALGAAILGIVPGGQPFAPLAAGLAKVLPGGEKDAETQRKAKWAAHGIPGWKGYCKAMMTLNFPDQTKAAKLQRAIHADWFNEFGEEPKDRWVRQLAENVYDAVLQEMAEDAIMQAAAAKEAEET